MVFRLVQKSVTLNDLEQRNDRFCVISLKAVCEFALSLRIVERLVVTSCMLFFSGQFMRSANVEAMAEYHRTLLLA